MLVARLVMTIEKHAEQLTGAVVHELRTDPRTMSYHKLEPHEDHAHVFAVIRNLGEWLDCESDAASENAYRTLGKRRFWEGTPLAEVVWALILTKQTLRRFIQSEGWVDTALDLRQQVDLDNLISRFFERAVYFTVLSYEAEARLSGKMVVQTETTSRRSLSGWVLRRSAKAV